MKTNYYTSTTQVGVSLDILTYRFLFYKTAISHNVQISDLFKKHTIHIPICVYVCVCV